MAAPALVALAHGSRDPRSAATITALVDEVRSMRPDLGSSAPSSTCPSRRSTPSSTGCPASTRRSSSCRCCSPRPTTRRSTCPSAIAAAQARHPEVQIRATPILGLEARFLEVLDLRMREALAAARARELDALVLAAAGSSDPLANQSVARLARLWGSHHKLPVTAAFASTAPPATGEAVRAFRKEGRRHIAVASLFLAPGLPAGPGRRAGPRGRRRRGLRAARRPPRDRAHGAGAVRRGCGGAGSGLSRSAICSRYDAESRIAAQIVESRCPADAPTRRVLAQRIADSATATVTG